MRKFAILKCLFICTFINTLSCQNNPYTVRPTGDLLFENDGFFFDDFNNLPRHQKFKDSSLFRYSRGSIVGKESLKIEKNGNESYLSSTIYPGQYHDKIGGFRAEMTIAGGNIKNKDEWFEWGFMIPKTSKLDNENIGKEVSIVQFYCVKENNVKILNRPTVDFLYLEQYNKNILLLRYGINSTDKNKLIGHRWQLIALNDNIEKGEWYKLRVNIKWSKTNTGYIATWLNDKPFTPFNGVDNKVYGANMYNDINNTFKFGYYRYWDNSTPTSIYFDYLKIARSFKELTGELPSFEKLYGDVNDYRYLKGKHKVLHDIEYRKD